MSLADLPRFAALFKATAARYGLDPSLVGAIALKESALDPRAYNPADPRGGAFGLMQVLEGTARDLGYAGGSSGLFDPALNVQLGTRLLAENLARVRRATPGLAQLEAENRAVAAYNAGWSRIRPGDPPRTPAGEFVNAAYVARVRQLQGLLASLKPIAGGLAAVAALGVLGFWLLVVRPRGSKPRAL